MLENYIKLDNGTIKQIEIINKIQNYDVEYVNSRYNSYGEKRYQMAYLRLGYLIGQIGKIPKKILDIGYGNGDFLDIAKKIVNNCYGNDISEYPLPNGIEFVEDIFEQHYDVITFFDVLEHFTDISFVKKLKCDYLLISLPWCHYFSDDWFKNWKHRRPDEHLWFFDKNSLTKFMDEMGFDTISITNIEDTIRKDNDAISNGYENILTGVFKKKIIWEN